MSSVNPLASAVTAPTATTAPSSTAGASGLDKKSALFQFMLNQLLNPPNVLTDAGGTDDDEDDGGTLAVKASGFPVV